jgi:hypothetical protein
VQTYFSVFRVPYIEQFRWPDPYTDILQ